MRFKRSKVLQETVELNITAFLNLMVILIPFLLVTAVFSRMTVLELTLPPLNADGPADEKIDLQLELLLYPGTLEIRDAALGRIRQFNLAGDSIDWPQVREVLLAIKQKFPDETAVTLLLDPAVPYKRLIEVMDHVRSMEVVNVTTLQEVELFPTVAIGQAPPLMPDVPADISLDALAPERASP
jgi:biopolymer transport protein ExbD